MESAPEKTANGGASKAPAHIDVRDLTVGYGDFVVQRNLNFKIRRGEVFVVMGGSGCGKSTVLRNLVGLAEPMAGEVFYDGVSFTKAEAEVRDQMLRHFGILYQGGALWGSMTLAENVGLPLEEFTDLTPRQIRDVASLKLALVGLKGSEDSYPSEISGGMRKRAGLARALALDPDILFFDEPSAGLDPITSQRLDELILELRDGLGATVILVSHELPSLLAICDDGVFLDADAKTAIGHGAPRHLRDTSTHPTIQAFMRRSSSATATTER